MQSMPNFPPLRRYVFTVVDRLVARHRLEGPFLEVGCGTGDLAEHLARMGWKGTAFDSSPEALERARARLKDCPGVMVEGAGLPAAPDGAFKTVFLMDVLEHVQDDLALLRTLASKLAPGGALVLLTPVNPGEWGHDDDIYGHFRRYGWEELVQKLVAAGFALEERWNVTVPFIWALRRFYLRFLPARGADAGRDKLTSASSFYNPWSQNAFLRLAGAVIGWRFWWAPLFRIQDGFRDSTGGHAAIFLARKTLSPNGGEGRVRGQNDT